MARAVARLGVSVGVAKAVAMDSVEAVGRMVRNAILGNTLFLPTNPLPSDIGADRVYTQYGSPAAGSSN